MQLVKTDLLALSHRIGQALRASEDMPLSYPVAIELLEALEDEISDLANKLTESEALPRLVCAWCSVQLRDGSAPVSHGICPTCQAQALAEIDNKRSVA